MYMHLPSREKMPHQHQKWKPSLHRAQSEVRAQTDFHRSVFTDHRKNSNSIINTMKTNVTKVLANPRLLSLPLFIKKKQKKEISKY